ncbi:phage tail protein [Pasteurellaceae bacterium 20609_3]|nr:phage tail protein [Spirabiliibacterium mucosae]
MPSPFDEALAHADVVISDTMMSPWQIGGEEYPAVFDESPHLFEGIVQYHEEYRVNGTKRTLTLFKASGYRPQVGHLATQGDKQFVVKVVEYQDQLIILHLE